LRLFQGSIVIALVLAAIALVLTVASSRVSGLPYLTEDLQVIEVSSAVSTATEAFHAFNAEGSSRRGYSASRQPEGPFWIALNLDGKTASGNLAIELRMLRTMSPKFWRFGTDGGETGRAQEISARSEKGGTTAYLWIKPDESVRLIGYIEPLGVARPKVFIWQESKYEESEHLFERGGGALLGAFLMLAFFSVFVGLVNRDWSFFLFAGWLITSLRVASINDGWDLIWLGIQPNNDSLLVFLRLTLAAHALLTVALFRSLLEKELSALRRDGAFTVAIAASSAIFLLGFALPHSMFLPVVWGASAVGMMLILLSLGAVVIKTRTTVSSWYAASWVITFLGILTEVAYASGSVATTIPGLNAQTASVASALMTAVALSEKLKRERSARLAAQRETLEILEQFKENYNSMPIGLFSLSENGFVSLSNPAFRAMFGVEGGRDSEHSFRFDSIVGEGSFARISAASDNNYEEDVELYAKSDDHAGRWFLARVTRKGRSIEGSIQDISARKAAEGKLKHLVDHDHLTGLLNRRGLETRIADAVKMVNGGVDCAIAYVDLDRFKLINDLHGHGIGDALLQQAAGRLAVAVRTKDCVARIADSFVVIFFDCPEHAILGLSGRLREAVAEKVFEVGGKALALTASIGVVSFEKEMTVVDAMAAADRACSEAKSRGRNCVVRLTDQDAALRSHLEELKVVADLQQHVPTERYFLEFQPIVALQSPMSSLCYEVLIRMRGEQGQIVPPGKFIGAAERNGLMSQIDRWVLRSTLEWLDNHPEHRERLGFATINISGASLNDNRFVDDAFSMIAEHPLAMPKLCFEITESVALHDLGSTRRFVDRVRMYGSKLALDDFGAGYTSFNYLKEIPANFIKIDGSFVKDINVNPANYAITRTIVDLTHELGMRSIAEWAETPDTIAALIELGVDYGQGFGLARPTAPEIVSAASSGAALIKDANVLALLNDRSRWQTAPRTGPRLQHKAA
jgi:diguanylate cyclase (GGDEF)-like protein